MGDLNNDALTFNSEDEGVEGFTNDPLLETPKKPKRRRGRPRKGENLLLPKVNYNTRNRISVSEATTTTAAASAKFQVDDQWLVFTELH